MDGVRTLGIFSSPLSELGVLFKRFVARPRSLARSVEDLDIAFLIVGRKGLTYSHIGMYTASHGSCCYHFRCVQCRGGAAPTGHPELSGAAGTAGWRHCGVARLGAAFRFQAPARLKGCWAGAREAGRTPHALSHECGSDSALARMGWHIRATVAGSIAAREGTCGREDEEDLISLNYQFKEER